MPLTNIEFSYGFGVYETIRVVNGVPHFARDHVERLMASAKAIGLEHTLSIESASQFIREFLPHAVVPTYNLKLLLIGAQEPEEVVFYVLPLNPRFPEKKMYRDGVPVITYPYERFMPHAKTLNMLPSYIAYRKARAAGAYDAIFIDRDGVAVEGSRTNLLAMKEKTLYISDPEKTLLGVTQKYVAKVALEMGLHLEMHAAKPSDLPTYDCAFLTGSSIGMLRIASVDGLLLGAGSESFRMLSETFDVFVDDPQNHEV